MSLRVLLAVFTISFLGFLGLRFPLGVAADWIAPGDVPLSWSSVEGTVWNGRFEGAQAGGIDLGTVEVGLSPWSLFLLKTTADARLSGGQVMGDLTFEQSLLGSRFAVRNAEILADLASFNLALPVTGSLSLEIEKLMFDDEGCREAVLSLESDALARGGQLPGWRGPRLAGEGACRDGKLLLPLEGNNQDGAVEVQMLLGPAGDYILELWVRNADNDAAPALIALGFEADGDRLRIRRTGRIGF